MNRNDIRKNIRDLRQNLTPVQQQDAAKKIKLNISQHLENRKNARIGIYISNDGEIDTSLIIEHLWQLNQRIYVPLIHPFCKGNLLFQRYEKNSPMSVNRYGIVEPKLDCSQVCPVEQLDVLFTPLVAFDLSGNRLGMGGGYYDRTLAKYYREKLNQPEVIGLAHECQLVEQVPTECWDVPLKTIITPKRCYQWPAK